MKKLLLGVLAIIVLLSVIISNDSKITLTEQEIYAENFLDCFYSMKEVFRRAGDYIYADLRQYQHIRDISGSVYNDDYILKITNSLIIPKSKMFSRMYDEPEVRDVFYTFYTQNIEETNTSNRETWQHTYLRRLHSVKEYKTKMVNACEKVKKELKSGKIQDTSGYGTLIHRYTLFSAHYDEVAKKDAEELKAKNLKSYLINLDYKKRMKALQDSKLKRIKLNKIKATQADTKFLKTYLSK